jgi:hypothetical protein
MALDSPIAIFSAVDFSSITIDLGTRQVDKQKGDKGEVTPGFQRISTPNAVLLAPFPLAFGCSSYLCLFLK